jgi:glycosyltransferase involved in cell wall biosynthesis
MLSRPLVYLHMHAPPTPGGTPVLLHRLLAGYSQDELEVVTDVRLRRAVRRGEGRLLPARYRFVPRKGLRGNRFLLGRVINALVNVVLAAGTGVRVAVLARRRDAGWILTVADEGFSVIAGCIAAALARRPHLIMVFDLWEENAYTDIERRLAHVLEPTIFRRAARVIVHCPEMAEHYRVKHGLECSVVPTPVEAWEPERHARTGREREILFAGAVYWAQEDSLRRLSAATRGLDGASLTIVGSWADEDALRRRGIVADRLEPDLPPDQFRRRLEKADALFLGLGFDTDHPEVVRTASPAKLPEYMMSGRPILIHAPAGSHVAEYARTERFAEVVDVPDEAALRHAVELVLRDDNLGRVRSERARTLANERHEIGRVRAAFTAIIESCR